MKRSMPISMPTSCNLRAPKNVIVISSAGATVTTIDGRRVAVIQNVLLITVGGEFGRPGKGFTVTETAPDAGNGVVLDAVNVRVRGNQIIHTRIGINSGHGVITVNDAAVRIEGNQVMNWSVGIHGRGAATVSKNQVMNNNRGIEATGGDIVGNVATSNCVGISLYGTATALGNAASMNRCSGFSFGPTFSGVFTKNNVFANAPCGLENSQVPGLTATNNYWGTDTGPGAPPADNVCNNHGGTTITSPFAGKPFTVKVLKP